MRTTGTAVPRPGRALAGVAAGLGALGVATGAVLSVVDPLLTAPRPSDLPGLLGHGCALALLLGWGWFALTTALCLVEAVLAGSAPAASPARRSAGSSVLRPAAARRLAALLLGTGVGGLAGLLAVPAAVAGGPASGPVPPTPVPLPARPVGGTVADPDTAAERPTATVRVRAGDCLWTIAEAHLVPPRSDDAAVDAAWRRLYAANRPVVGADPHLIRPGTRLDLPSPAPTEGRP